MRIERFSLTEVPHDLFGPWRGHFDARTAPYLNPGRWSFYGTLEGGFALHGPARGDGYERECLRRRVAVAVCETWLRRIAGGGELDA